MKRRKLTQEKADSIQRRIDTLHGNCDSNSYEHDRVIVRGSTCRACNGTGKFVCALQRVESTCSSCRGTGRVQQ